MFVPACPSPTSLALNKSAPPVDEKIFFRCPKQSWSIVRGEMCSSETSSSVLDTEDPRMLCVVINTSVFFMVVCLECGTCSYVWVLNVFK